MAAKSKVKRKGIKVAPNARKRGSFSDKVKAELDQIFKVDTNFKTQYKHLKTLAKLLKTRALRTVSK